MNRSRSLRGLVAVLTLGCAVFGTGCVAQTEPSPGDPASSDSNPATESPQVQPQYDHWNCFHDCNAKGASEFCACACGIIKCTL